MELEIVYVDNEYKEKPTLYFEHVPEMAKPILKKAENSFLKIEKALYTAPAFVNAVRAAVPEEALQAVLTNDQKQQIAKGALKLMTKKDGTLLANLVNPETNKIVATIPLKSVQMAPQMLQALTSFSAQMVLMQIAEQIQSVQIAVEEVRMGQEYDRLATAYSCQQKLLQIMEIKNPELKVMALMHLVSDAEDSRNLLMLSQKNNVKFIMGQPEGTIDKFFNGAKPEEINGRMNEIRQSLCSINMVSYAEAIAYQELGEYEAARKSLNYYADFIENTYMSKPEILHRLDMIDPSPKRYWSKTLPIIRKRIESLPVLTGTKLLETKKSRRKRK